jgi:hypothetical protein
MTGTPRRWVARVFGVGALALALSACGSIDGGGRSFPIASVGPAMTVSPAVDQTRADLVRVLGAQSLVLSDTQVPVRKAESPLMAAAPRAVYQVVLPKDPNRGYIVVYEFPDAGRAAAAAAEEQAYLGSGPGRVQTPQGTVTLIRQVGSTIILYDWLPGASLDPSAAGIQTALEGLGVAFPVAN